MGSLKTNNSVIALEDSVHILILLSVSAIKTNFSLFEMATSDIAVKEDDDARAVETARVILLAFRKALFPESATRTFPFLNTAIPDGALKEA